MTDSAAAIPDGSDDVGYPSPPDCSVDLLDDLKCEATGIKAQAEYNAKHTTELETARTSYDTARVQYRAARGAAKKTYKDLGTQLEKVLEQLKCLIDDRTKVGWLDRAFDTVAAELVACGGESGCGFDDTCDFGELIDCPPGDIAGAIEKIEERVAKAKKVFDDLVQEPTELPKRVTAVQKEVDDIVKEMATDSRSVDFKALYAKALVAKYHRDNLWRGFHDGNAYVDCLCCTLLCQLKGYDAVSQLTRKQEVKKCRDDAEAEQCKQLHDHTDVAVMEEYEKIKAAAGKDYGGGQQGGYGDKGQQGDDYPGPPGGDYPTQGGGDYPTSQGGDGGDEPTPGGGYGQGRPTDQGREQEECERRGPDPRRSRG